VNQMEAWGQSSRGLVRPNNEDFFHIDPNNGLIVVADGMGGHNAGEIASRIAVESLHSYLTEHQTGLEDPAALLETSIQHANSKVYRLSRENSHWQGMGTTLTAVLERAGRVLIGHIGDSRLYLWREGNMERLTTDHSVVEEMMAKGLISEIESQSHPYRHMLTRALGMDIEVTVDISEMQTQPGDKLLLCTDGLTNHVRDEEISNILTRSLAPDQAGVCLIELALARGGLDNITIIIADIGQETQRGETRAR